MLFLPGVWFFFPLFTTRLSFSRSLTPPHTTLHCYSTTVHAAGFARHAARWCAHACSPALFPCACVECPNHTCRLRGRLLWRGPDTLEVCPLNRQSNSWMNSHQVCTPPPLVFIEVDKLTVVWVLIETAEFHLAALVSGALCCACWLSVMAYC